MNSHIRAHHPDCSTPLVEAIGFPHELRKAGYRPIGKVNFKGGQECSIYKCFPRPGLSGPLDMSGNQTEITDANPVAIKVLNKDASNYARDLLAREGAALGNIDARAVPWRYESSTLGDGRPYITQDYIAGPTLLHTMSCPYHYFTTETPTRPEEIEWVRLAYLLVSTLSRIHSLGYLHLDIKPSNIVLHGVTGEPWLVDFGLSVHIGKRRRELRPPAGTIPYAAPEMLRDNNVDTYSDVFAICMTLAHALTGVNLRDPDGEATAHHKRLSSTNPAAAAEFLKNYHQTQKPQLDLLPEPARRALTPGLETDPKLRPLSARDLLSHLDWSFAHTQQARDAEQTIRVKGSHAEPGGAGIGAHTTLLLPPEPITSPVWSEPLKGGNAHNLSEWVKKTLIYFAYDIEYGHASGRAGLIGFGAATGITAGVLVTLALILTFGDV